MMAKEEYIEKWKVVNMLIEIENRAQGTYRENGEKLYRDLVETEMRIGKLTAADVAPVRHGRWLPQVVLGQKAWDCSECKTIGSPQWKWCPVCGAKMEGGAENG